MYERYASFNRYGDISKFIAFLVTQICELDNIAQQFNQKKE